MSSSRFPSAGNVPRHKLLRLKLGFRVLLLSPGTITIGRRKNCDLVLDDPQTSREHARVIVGDQSAAIQDLGSGNGVLLNGRRISGLQRLSEGDRIQIGVHTIEVLGQAESMTPGLEDSETTVIGIRPSVGQPAEWVDEGPTQAKKPDRD